MQIGSSLKIIGCVIQYITSYDASVVITVNDKPDHVVTTLVDGNMSSGIYQLLWSLKNAANNPLPKGIYRVYMTATSTESSRVRKSYGDIQIY